MKFAHYSVLSEDGDLLAGGIRQAFARKAAQQVANELKESVWLFPAGGRYEKDAKVPCDSAGGERFDPKK